jgi:hypothetical protein
MKDCVRASERVAIAHQNAHLTEQLMLRQMKINANPGNLKREKDKSAGSEVRLEPTRPTAAKLAFAVE